MSEYAFSALLPAVHLIMPADRPMRPITAEIRFKAARWKSVAPGSISSAGLSSYVYGPPKATGSVEPSTADPPVPVAARSTADFQPLSKLAVFCRRCRRINTGA